MENLLITALAVIYVFRKPLVFVLLTIYVKKHWSSWMEWWTLDIDGKLTGLKKHRLVRIRKKIAKEEKKLSKIRKTY